MQNKFHTFLLVIAVFLLGFMSLRPSGTGEGEPAKKSETAFERVMRTRTIRCAYGQWPPLFMINPTTKEFSGTDYEIMEEIGRLTGLKIVWASEFPGVGSVPEQLQSGKQDVCCTALWANPKRAQRVEMSSPVAYMPLYAYVRDGDTRFDNRIEALNDENVRIAVADGGAQVPLAQTNFPKAKQYNIPEDQPAVDTFLAVITKKADVVFSDPMAVHDYNEHNPSQKLRRVSSEKPLKVFANVFVTAKGEWQLRDLLSSAVQELQSDGMIDRILKKYESEPGTFLRVAAPYQSGG
ncbi:MAG: substrate-binding periplasmic protein [Bdellovibrionales bacterium]